jgi:hypothetical protein
VASVNGYLRETLIEEYQHLVVPELCWNWDFDDIYDALIKIEDRPKYKSYLKLHRSIEKATVGAIGEKGSGSKVCYAWQSGSCDRGDQCKFAHEGEAGSGKGKGKGKGNGNGKGKGKGNGGKKVVVWTAPNGCKNGNINSLSKEDADVARAQLAQNKSDWKDKPWVLGFDGSKNNLSCIAVKGHSEGMKFCGAYGHAPHMCPQNQTASVGAPVQESTVGAVGGLQLCTQQYDQSHVTAAMMEMAKFVVSKTTDSPKELEEMMAKHPVIKYVASPVRAVPVVQDVGVTEVVKHVVNYSFDKEKTDALTIQLGIDKPWSVLWDTGSKYALAPVEWLQQCIDDGNCSGFEDPDRSIMLVSATGDDLGYTADAVVYQQLTTSLKWPIRFKGVTSMGKNFKPIAGMVLQGLLNSTTSHPTKTVTLCIEGKTLTYPFYGPLRRQKPKIVAKVVSKSKVKIPTKVKRQPVVCAKKNAALSPQVNVFVPANGHLSPQHIDDYGDHNSGPACPKFGDSNRKRASDVVDCTATIVGADAKVETAVVLATDVVERSVDAVTYQMLVQELQDTDTSYATDVDGCLQREYDELGKEVQHVLSQANWKSYVAKGMVVGSIVTCAAINVNWGFIFDEMNGRTADVSIDPAPNILFSGRLGRSLETGVVANIEEKQNKNNNFDVSLSEGSNLLLPMWDGHYVNLNASRPGVCSVPGMMQSDITDVFGQVVAQSVWADEDMDSEFPEFPTSCINVDGDEIQPG